MRINQKLTVVTISLSVIPLLFVMGLSYKNARDGIEKEIYAKLEITRKLKADKLETFFKTCMSDLVIQQARNVVKTNLPVLCRFRRNRSDLRVQEAKKLLDYQFGLLLSARPYINILLLDSQGRIVYVSDQAFESARLDRPLPDSDPNLFEKSKRLNQIGDIYQTGFPDHPLGKLLVGAVTDSRNRVIGSLALSVDMQFVYEFLQDMTGLGKTGETLLVQKISDNRIRFISPLRHDTIAVLKKEIVVGSSVGLPAQEALQGRSGIGESVDYRGIRVLSSWQNIPSLDWGLVAKIDIDEAFAPVENFKKLMILIVTITLVFVVLASISTAKIIADPIHELHKGTEIIGRGNLDYKVGRPTRDEIGQLSRAFDVMVDNIKKITASRAELEAIRQDLERSNAELEQFAYVSSHDLKSPLRAIESLALWIEEDMASTLTDSSRQHLDLLRQRVRRMERLLNDLLDYSRIGRVGHDVQVVNTADLAAQARDLLNIPEGFRVEIRPPMPVLKTQATPLRQVFQNLIGNAVKHHDRKEGLITVSSIDKGDFVEFHVADDGPGIPKEFHKRVFGMFQTLKPRDEVEGSGIGLAVVKKTVEQFGGYITIESGESRGIAFRFTWPKTTEDKPGEANHA
jgi:signal transduction histidine kinase